MVLAFCLLLMVGILLGQICDLSGLKEILSFVTSSCLAYIMMEVGIEFSAEKKHASAYGKDFLVASTAAILPALLLFAYFMSVTHSQWKPALLSGLSAAPTSAGVLFAMLMAAGLSGTWVFRKARVLAVLDDLVTIMLLMPLQIIIQGFQWNLLAVLLLICLCLYVSLRWPNTLCWPSGQGWLLVYGIGLAGILLVIKNTVHIHLEVLIPAFMVGCLLVKDHAPPSNPVLSGDTFIKGVFMFLVGISLPKIDMGSWPMAISLGHVLALTFLANLGKSFLLLCYKKEAPLSQRVALSVAMFPRGEVGAAVLLIGFGFGLNGYENTLAALSLGLNLVLTGAFISFVIFCLSSRGDNK